MISLSTSMILRYLFCDNINFFATTVWQFEVPNSETFSTCERTLFCGRVYLQYCTGMVDLD